MSRVNKGILSIAIVSILVIATLSISYASFTDNLNSDEYASTLNLKDGKLQIAYSGGNSIEISNINAGKDEIYSKTFSVKGTNNNTNNLNYKLNLVIEENTFDGKITFDLIGYNPLENGKKIDNIENKIVLNENNTIELGSGYFNNSSDVVHTYTLKFYYLEGNTKKNNKLKAHIEIGQ